MFCRKCGKEISDNSNFCEFCGCKISVANKPWKKNYKIVLLPILIGVFYSLLALPLTYKTEFLEIPVIIKLAYNPIKLQMTLNVGAIAYTLDNVGWLQAIDIRRKLIFGDYKQIQNFNTQNSELHRLLGNNNVASDYPKVCKSNINYGNWKKEWTENCILNDTIYCKNAILVVDKEHPVPKTQTELENRCFEASEEADIEYEADKNYYENLCKDKNYIREIAKMNDNADWWDDMCGTDWRN